MYERREFIEAVPHCKLGTLPVATARDGSCPAVILSGLQIVSFPVQLKSENEKLIHLVFFRNGMGDRGTCLRLTPCIGCVSYHIQEEDARNEGNECPVGGWLASSPRNTHTHVLKEHALSETFVVPMHPITTLPVSFSSRLRRPKQASSQGSGQHPSVRVVIHQRHRILTRVLLSID